MSELQNVEHKLERIPHWVWAAVGIVLVIGIAIWQRRSSQAASNGNAGGGVPSGTAPAGGGASAPAVDLTPIADAITAESAASDKAFTQLQDAITTQTQALAGAQAANSSELSHFEQTIQSALASLAQAQTAAAARNQAVPIASTSLSTPSASSGGGSGKSAAQTAAENAYNAATGGAGMVGGSQYVQNNGNGTFIVVVPGQPAKTF